MTQIDPSTVTLGALVAERPACAQLFERLRIDFCCGGAATLADACAERGLDPGTVATLIETLGGAPDQEQTATDETDWRSASITDLCEHIVSVHHDGLRRELPHISELMATVVRVHGDEQPDLHDLQRMFTALRDDLEHHIELEERTVFPVCRRLEADQDTPLDEDTLELLEDEHASTGDALVAMRELADDYDPTHGRCGTHRALLEALLALEVDVHQHVHEENNVLFPRVRALAGAVDGQPSAGR